MAQYWVEHSILWRHNGCDGVPNHQPHDCSLNRLFRRRSNKTWKLRVTGLCAGNSPLTGEFPAHYDVTAMFMLNVWLFPDFRWHLSHFEPYLIRQFVISVYPHDNLSHACAGISKFAPSMHLGTRLIATLGLMVPYVEDSWLLFIKWKHFRRYWPFVRGIHRSPVNFPHEGQWRRTLIFCLICAWIYGWVTIVRLVI